MPDQSQSALPITRALKHCGHTQGIFFCEGPSPWPEGRKNRPGRSMEDASRDQDNLTRALFRRQDDAAAGALLVDLAGPCLPEMPCLNGACSTCDLAGQRLKVDLIQKARPLLGDELSLVTVIATGGSAHLVHLRDQDLFRQTRKRLVDVFKPFDIPIIGGLEISINEAADHWHKPRVVEHGHLIVPRLYAESLREPLKREFRATKGISRPVQIKDFDGSIRGIAYAVKNRAMRRVDLGRDADGIRRTRWKPLRCAERIDLALAQSRAGLDACTFAHGLRLVCGEGALRLVREETHL